MAKDVILMICPVCYKSFPAQTKLCSQCNVKLLVARHRHLRVLTRKTKKKRRKVSS